MPVLPSARLNVPVAMMSLPLSVMVEGVEPTAIETMS